MQAPKVILVSPYDYGEVCAMACSLAGLLEGLPLRVILLSSEPLQVPYPEVHLRYDRRVWSQPIVSYQPDGRVNDRLWQDTKLVIWFCARAFRRYRHLGLGTSIRSRERKHILVDLAEDFVRDAEQSVVWDEHGEQRLVRVRVGLGPRALRGHSGWSPRWDYGLPWDSDLPFSVKPVSSQLKLLVMAGVWSEDRWSRQYSRAARQVKLWLERIPNLFCRIICAVPAPRLGLGDITPPQWRRLREEFPERVQTDMRSLNYLRRAQLYREHDFVWNLSPHVSQMWTLEAAVSGCGVLVSDGEAAPVLKELLRPCCVVLPDHDVWLKGSAEESHADDERGWQVFRELVAEWKSLPRPWSRPVLERHRRDFHTFWKQQLGLESETESVWTENGEWRSVEPVLRVGSGAGPELKSTFF